MNAGGPFSRERMIGELVSLTDVDAFLNGITNIWLSTLHRTESGAHGWNRSLTRADSVGIVAIAQGILGLRAAGADVPDLHDIVKSLLQLRLPGGGWPFKANIVDTVVVDATAWALLALEAVRDEPGLDDLDLDEAIAGGVDALEEAALPTNGWGITATGGFRVYSTAVAIRAVCGAMRADSPCVQFAVQALLDSVDASVGVWCDASRHVSVAVTAET
jgi:hypothetical protein